MVDLHGLSAFDLLRSWRHDHAAALCAFDLIEIDGKRRSPWSVEELDACYVVRDHDGQQLAYIYFEDEPGRRSAAKAAQQG